MPKYRVLDPKGFYDGRTKHPTDAEIQLSPGARLDAALHFKQVALVKEKAPEPEDPKGPKK